MDMAIRLEALLGAIGVGIFVWQFVVPMIAKIPFSMEKEWRDECMEYAQAKQRFPSDSRS